MDDRFVIYIDRLRFGSTEEIALDLAPSFLGVDEPDLKFKAPVCVRGKAYVTEDHLILHLDIKTMASMPCKRCNAIKDVPIELKGYYHTVPLEEIRDHLFDMSETLRDDILLEVPAFYACEEGECEDLGYVKKELKSEGKKGESHDTYHPFADLK